MGDALALSDEKIRRVFTTAVAGGSMVSKREARAIIKQARDNGTISLGELADLELILGSGAITAAAKQHIEQFIRKRRTQTAPKLDPKRVKDTSSIVSTLRANSGYLTFRNPATNASYQPGAYLKVARLIEDGDVEVKEFDYGKGPEEEVLRSRTDGGVYDQYDNIFWLLRIAGARRTEFIIHEATHVIQDFRNSVILHKHAEADAYIAGALALFHMENNRDEVDLRGPEQKKTALTSKDPLKAAALSIASSLRKKPGAGVDKKDYDKLVNAIKADHGYSKIAERQLTQGKGQKPSDSWESKRWTAIKLSH